MTRDTLENVEMDDESIPSGETQEDFIRNELNFNVDINDPITKASLNEQPVEEWMDILGNGELRKKIIRKGINNMRPNRLDMCTLKIIGKLQDGTVVEDYDDLVIQLGDVEVVQGLDLGIALMDSGEIAEFEVAARFAYGKLGRKPDIPRDATIYYTVELKSIDFETDMETLTISQRKEIGDKKRERGNWWFARDEATHAIQCYRRALEFLIPTNTVSSSNQNSVEESASDAELQSLLEDRMKVYNNLAAAQMKTQAYDAALKSVESVLSCQPQNLKALFRKGKILHYKGEYRHAYVTLCQAAKVNPHSKTIQQELAVLKKKNAKYAQHEKNLYKKMLGTEKDDDPISKIIKDQSKGKNLDVFTWSLIGGITAAMFGVLVYRFAS